jgi:hypothetical protein
MVQWWLLALPRHLSGPDTRDVHLGYIGIQAFDKQCSLWQCQIAPYGTVQVLGTRSQPRHFSASHGPIGPTPQRTPLS